MRCIYDRQSSIRNVVERKLTLAVETAEMITLETAQIAINLNQNQSPVDTLVGIIASTSQKTR